MTLAGVREHLTVIPGSSGPGPRTSLAHVSLVPARAGYEHLTPQERSGQAAVATRSALVQRLSLLAAIAPAAPVSFLLVKIEGLSSLERLDPSGTPAIVREVAAALSRLADPTDLVGWVQDATFGVVLQGRTAGSAALTSARISHHLNLLPVMRHPARARVAAATGTGASAGALLAAATDTLAYEASKPGS